MKAMWNNVVIAESSATEIVDGNHYFPFDSIKSEYFAKTELTTVCGWKGKANYRSGTCWLALSEVTEKMGALQFVPGSHLEGIAEHIDATHKNPINGALEVHVDESKAVQVEYGPGDATIHHSRTLHYTSGNDTDQPRRGLSTHLWPEPNE